MKFSLMREYVKLAETKNFSRAAEELYIAQPALSRHIAKLEDELGTRLINRTRNSFELTKAGEVVANDFQKLLGEYEAMLEKLARLNTEVEGALRLGFLYYDRDYYVAQIREAFRQNYPHVKLSVRSYQPEKLERDLLNGKIDVAMIYSAKDCTRKDICAMPFLSIPFLVIVALNHRFASMGSFELSMLDGEILLAPENDLEICRAELVLERLLEEHHARPAGIIPIEDFDEVPWLLRETGAVYVSPLANPKAFSEETHVVQLPERYSSDVSLVWRADNDNPAIKLFCNSARTCCS